MTLTRKTADVAELNVVGRAAQTRFVTGQCRLAEAQTAVIGRNDRVEPKPLTQLRR
jgi:hypothetical protein